MKFVNRKTVLVLTLLVTLSFMFTGCGKSSTSADEAVKSDVKTAEATDSAAKLAAYEMDVIYACGSVPKDIELVQEEMNKQLTEKINATVKLKPIDWGSWLDKTKLMFTSGDKIDAIISSASLQYADNIARGAYQPLDDLINQYGQDIVNVVGMDLIKGAAVNGKIYGIPVYKEFGSNYGFVYNKALVDKYNFDITSVKRLEDLEPMLKTIKEKEPGITPLNMSGRTVSNMLGQGMFDQLGTMYPSGVLSYDSTDLKVVDYYEQPVNLDALKWSHKMFKQGYVNKSSLTDKDEGVMKNGKAFVMAYELKPGKDKELEAAWGIPVVQSEFYPSPVASCDASKGIMASIGRTSENPERTMMFLNLLYNDSKLLNTFIFGVEGKHYVKNGNAIDFPEGVDAKTVSYKNEAWMFGNQFMNYLWASEDPQKWEKFKEFNSKVKKSPALGFAFNAEPVKAEMAATDTIFLKYKTALEIGSVDPDAYVPKMVSELKAAGLDKIIAEKQKQLDDWAKTK